MTDTTANRRPLKTRSASIPKKIAYSLAQKNITPNQISLMSVVFAALSGACLILSIQPSQYTWLIAVMAGVFIQCRLLCNLFDGMVAIEGGKSTKSGELFNDIPDRFADAIILVCAGYTITQFSWGPMIGWLSALLAVMTAYVRTLSASMSAPMDFSGPMAKQHRMFIMTMACLAYAVELTYSTSQYVMATTLIIICVGCLMTLYRRIRAAYRHLEGKNHA